MPLKVETNHPMMNAGAVAVGERDGQPEVAFAPDPHGGPEVLWFNFRIVREGDAPAPGSKFRLALKNPDVMLGGSEPQHLRPVLRRANGDWERLGAGEREDLADGRVRMVWHLTVPETWLEFAVCYPYGHLELLQLRHDTGATWFAAAIGLSQHGRPITRLSSDPGVPGGSKPGIYLIARQHAGETTGSWVMDGFLRWVAAHRDQAPMVWAVPFADIDGVEQGDYGKDKYPYDLNRAWGDPPMRHETHVISLDMKRWKSRCRAAFALDFHAPGACEAEGIYAFLPDPKRFPLEHKQAERWAGVLNGALVPQFVSEKMDRIAYYASRWNTPNFVTHCFQHLHMPALTVEIPYALSGRTVFTRELYREAGERIAAAICREVMQG